MVVLGNKVAYSIPLWQRKGGDATVTARIAYPGFPLTL